MHYRLMAFSVCALAALACSHSGERLDGPRLELAVAPLELAGIHDACYQVAVYDVDRDALSEDALVWRQSGLCASRYGDDGGSIAYVGTCDASPDGRTNTVALVLEGLCTDAGCDVGDLEDAGTLDPDDYVNPCPAGKPCTLERPCRENADTEVTFNLTIMRRAHQGFFDLAVSFEDVFCSAKLDCVPALLHRPDGERDLTAVLAFACTAGPDDDTCLYADDVVIDCGEYGRWSVDPSAGPGVVPEDSPLLYGAAVYEGEEAYTDFAKRYWNVALGLEEGAFPVGATCTLSWQTTVAAGELDGGATPDDTAYPRIVWSRDFIVDGALACGHHALDEVADGEEVASVATDYVDAEAPWTPAYARCSLGDATCNCAEGWAPNVSGDRCVFEETLEPTQTGVTWPVCPGLANTEDYSSDGARFHATLTPGAMASDQVACAPASVCVREATPEWVNRLSRVGVWTCDGDAGTHMNPLNEWIGFSRCVDLDAAGDYLVGIAGDNQVMLKVDGQVVYQSSASLNFRSWNVFRVPLSGGQHVLELYGLNEGLIASFGAEIAGPFAPGSIDTPTQMAAADFDGHLVFTTASMRTPGYTFQTSTGDNGASGVTCAAGYALDLCQPTPVCTRHLEQACDVVE